MTEKTIKPEDIRIGDRIRVEWMTDDILRAETGTVAKIDTDGDLSTQAWFIGPACIQKRVNDGEKITITLLERPKPPLPTEVGSVIHVSECRGVECDALALLDDDGWWYTPIKVARDSFHISSDITEWEPRNVVEVQE